MPNRLVFCIMQKCSLCVPASPSPPPYQQPVFHPFNCLHFSSPISLFLVHFMSHFPFSYLLLISHTNISSHLLLPLSLAIFLVSVSLSYLSLVLPHVLSLLLSLFSAHFFQVPRTSPYLHFPFVLLLILRTLLLLLSSLTSLLSRCYSSYHATPFALCIIFVH